MLSLRNLANTCRSNDQWTWVLAVSLSVATALAVSSGSPANSSEDEATSIRIELSSTEAAETPKDVSQAPQPSQHVRDLMAPKPDLGPWDYDDGLTASLSPAPRKTCSGAGDNGQVAPWSLPVDLAGSPAVRFRGYWNGGDWSIH